MSSPPSPDPPGTSDDLAARLQELRSWAGVSYRELHRRVVADRRRRNVPELPAYDTVYRCLQPGRSRLDSTLVMDIVRVLGGTDLQAWRHACQVLMLDGTGTAVTATTLPPRPPHVTGRAAELARLLAPATVGRTRWLVSGMAGVGKTTLAVEAAYRLSGRVPTGRAWFVDAGGTDGSRRAPASSILEGLLRLLGVPSSTIARADVRGRVALFEAVVGRDVVIVVDDVDGPDQVEPLLTARGPFALLITSRQQLAFERPVPTVPLDVLAPLESVDLLAAALADPAVATAGEASVLADLAGHLPLALAGIVGRIRARSTWTLADHVEQLSELHGTGRVDSVVDASLQLSYAGLSPEERELLRRVALHPAPGWSCHAAAAMAGVEPATVEPLLRGLLRVNLLRDDHPDRYRLHELVQAFARARALDEDSPSARRAALERLYAYHERATKLARSRWSRTSTRSESLDASATIVPDLTSRSAALAWLTAERTALLVTAHHALEEGRPDHSAAMSGLLFRFLEQENYVDDATRLHRAVADATAGLDRARALNCLGVTAGTVGRWTDARAAFAEALDLFAEADDPDGIGWVVGNLGAVCWHLQDYRAALDYSQWSLRIAEDGLDLSGQAISLHNLALILDRLGRTTEGLHHHRRSLVITQELGDLVGESRGLSSLGAALVREALDGEARPILEQALRTARAAESRLAECEALSQLAALSSRAGDHAKALTRYREALRLAVDQGRPDTMVEIEVDLGTGLLRAGHVDEAIAVLRSALAGARDLQDRYYEARAVAELARADQTDIEPRSP